MPDKYQRISRPFNCTGLDLNHDFDNIPDDKYGVLTNLRSNQQGTLQTRPPLQLVEAAPVKAPVHSIKTFQNTADKVFKNFKGIGSKIYVANTQVDSGYSGNPLTWAAYQPLQSVEPFLYAADSLRYSKFRDDGTRFNVGIIPPAGPPDMTMAPPVYSIVSDLDSASGWTAAGTATGLAALQRVPAGISIAHILYDSGTTGWASMSYSGTATSWFGAGARFIYNSGGGSQESAIVQSVIPAGSTASVTISAIQYDSGSTGLACVVLSLATAAIAQDALIQLNSEVVRVRSVSVGQDNSVSVRVSTVSTHAAGETVTFFNTVRIYFTNTHAGGETVTGNSLAWNNTAGVGTISQLITPDLSQAAGRPLTAQDYLHLSVFVDNLNNVVSVRILFNVDAVDTTFSENYYYAEFSQNLFQAAISGNISNSAAQLLAIQQAAIQASPATISQPGFPVSGGSPVSLQLYSGGSQWSEVLLNFTDLQRVGTDQSRTLANINAIQIEVTTTGVANISVDSWWAGGTYGPDAPVGINPLNPIKVQYRYRSTITGSISAPSVLTRYGEFPQRQGLIYTALFTNDLQCDTIDFARVGGSVDGTPLYVGSIPNKPAGGTGTFLDNFADAGLGDALEVGALPPWPIEQLPIVGTCSVVGTTVFSTSVPLPANLAPGTLVIVNGITTIIRGQPGLNIFQVEDNIGFYSGVVLQINAPTTYGNPLPYISRAYNDLILACGDAVNPGRLYFSNAKDPDSAATSNYLDLSSASDPLIGCDLYNQYAFAFTSERFFIVQTTTDADNPLSGTEANVGQGVLGPYAYAVGPMIFFNSRNGIQATDLGPSKSITENDLYPFLPHDGQSGFGINGYNAPDITQVNFLRMAYSKNGWLYFDFQDTTGQHNTLCFNINTPGWWFDSYLPQATIHYQQELEGSIALLCGCVDGTVQSFSSVSQEDSGGNIACHLRTKAFDFGDLRARKQFGDLVVFADASAAVLPTGMVVTLLADDWGTQIAQSTLTGARTANQIPIDIDAGDGSLNVNAAIDVQWSGQGTLYEFDLSALIKPERTQLRTTDWIDLGQSFWLQGLRVTANTGGVQRTVKVECDFLQGLTFELTMTHLGEVQLPYSFTPVIAHRIRLTPADTGDVWELFAVEPIGEPSPESVQYWETQPTSHDQEGYQHVREICIPLYAGGPVTIGVQSEFPGDIELTSVDVFGFKKVYVPLPANKSMWYQWSVNAPQFCRIFVRDIEVRTKAWGSSGPYVVVRPFGDVSRANGGARI